MPSRGDLSRSASLFVVPGRGEGGRGGREEEAEGRGKEEGRGCEKRKDEGEGREEGGDGGRKEDEDKGKRGEREREVPHGCQGNSAAVVGGV